MTPPVRTTRRFRHALPLVLLLASIAHAPAQPAAPSPALFGELGCAQCHGGLNAPTSIREQAPDLSDAGLRYRPAYLFDFLLNPRPVRRHIGRARMPDFHLAAPEALALVAFLETQQRASDRQAQLTKALATAGNPATPLQTTFPPEGLLCLTCHALDGKGGAKAVDLGSISSRLQPACVESFLASPGAFGVPANVMPPQFFRASDNGERFEPLIPNPAEKIASITRHLFSLNHPARDALEQKIDAARKTFPQSNAALGQQLFTALNCAACHRHQTITPRLTNAAPDLAAEGSRVNARWLENYLRHPTAIRPAGHRPGDGSRMPDFRLSESEAAELAHYFTAPTSADQRPASSFQPRELSAFAQGKARLLFTQKLPCLGCHQLGDQGGRIGPDLTAVRERLQPAYVHHVITNPQQAAPHSIMPQHPLTGDMANLVANFLLQQPQSPQRSTYLSPVDNPLPLLVEAPPSTNTATHLKYLTHCAACHGAEGRGDGFNARFLPVNPTAHADARHMSSRPDDTLYDGIHAGGAVLNKSHLMPAWGLSLTPKEIKNLVSYMRTLCQCEGPAWSRDNQP